MVWSQSEEDIFKNVTDVSFKRILFWKTFVQKKSFSGNHFTILDLMVTLKTKLNLEH